MSRAASNFVLVLLLVPSFLAHGQGIPLSKNTDLHPGLRGSITITRQHGSELKLLSVSRAAAPVLLAPTERNNLEAARTAAVEIVPDLAASFGIPSSAAIEPVATLRVANVWQTTFQFSYNGIPVRDCRLHTMIGSVSGQLMSASCDLGSSEPNLLIPRVSSSTIITNLPKYLGDDRYLGTSSFSAPKLVFLNLPRNEIRLAFETVVRQSEPAHAWRLTIDAGSGRLMEKKDMLEYVGGDQNIKKPQTVIGAKILSLVHPHSPFDSSIVVGLPNTLIYVDGVPVTTDDSGYWTTDVLNLYPNVVTGFFNSTYHVERKDGRTDTAHVNHLKPPGYYLFWIDAFSKPAERDAWYHVCLARRYMRNLDPGLTRLDDPLTINVNINASCNAFYDADSNSLNFFQAGGDCTNTGEIADVIYHEFGHRVAAARYLNGSNARQVNRTLGEGFADLCSAFMRDDPRIGIGFYSADSTKILRSCDNSAVFTGTVDNDPHLAGEIIAGAFWDLRKLIGKDTAERLFHQMEWLNPDGPDQTGPDVMRPLLGSVLMDVLTLDDNDNNLENGSPHADQIIQAFANHGIYLTSFLQLLPLKTPDQDSSATGYPVIVDATYNAPIGTIDLTKFNLHYSLDGGKSYKSQPFTPIPGDTSHFESIIPKQKPGSVITYYSSASLTVDNGGATTTPKESFMVGFGRAYFDDCEHDNGWSLGLPSDDAVTGRWVRAVPYGTYNIPNHWVQQDSDHSPKGTSCYVTGNLHSREIWSDCVDSGTTTLTTNSIDLSEAISPILRYWFFYSNDQLFINGVPEWVVQLSSDDGTTWKEIQRISSSTDGWQSFWFRVSDYAPAATHVMLRYIASNSVQAVVEAGVDDLEILAAGNTAPPLRAAESNISPRSSSIQSIYPNPVSPTAEFTIRFSIAERTRATLVLKNVLGDVVADLTDQPLEPGIYDIPCSAPYSHLEPGIYWAVLSTGTKQSIQKVVIH